MKYPGYFHEVPQSVLGKKLKTYNHADQKTDIWNAFIDSNLSDITDDDFSVLPRVLPASYLPTIRKAAYLVTEFCLKLLSLPEREIRAIVPKGPIRDHLMNELQVLRHRHDRITGSFRFDMAMVGPADSEHPPYLLEINEIGFDGLARSTYFQKVLMELMPKVRRRLRSLDTAAAEIRNMQRLGRQVARVQYDNYNWDEEYLLVAADRLGSEIRLISPAQFNLKIDAEDFPLLQKQPFRIVGGKVIVGGWRPQAVNMSFAYSLADYREGHALYRRLVQSQTPQYGPFVTGLVASKTILTLLADPLLQRRLSSRPRALAQCILPAHLLDDTESSDSLRRPREWVLKHADGFGGEQVYMNQDLERQLKRIPAGHRHHWVLQKKTELNLIDVNGILSRPKQAIADLGVFVQYDWARGKFRHFEVGGLMSRATNKSLKVNVSSGGLQVAVLLDRAS